jgi:hypothetical protein
MATCFDIVAVRIDYERTVEWGSPNTGNAIILRAVDQTTPVKFVDRQLRRSSKAQVHRAHGRLRLSWPEAWPSCTDDEKWRCRLSTGNNHPAFARACPVLLNNLEAERRQCMCIEASAFPQIPDDNPDVIEHHCPLSTQMSHDIANRSDRWYPALENSFVK